MHGQTTLNRMSCVCVCVCVCGVCGVCVCVVCVYVCVLSIQWVDLSGVLFVRKFLFDARLYEDWTRD